MAMEVKQGVTAKQAVDLLKARGLEVSEAEATAMLDLLYLLAKLAVNQYFVDEGTAIDTNQQK